MKRLREGDVFLIPIDEHRNGVGQIGAIVNTAHSYFAIFDAVVEAGDQPDVRSILSRPLLFLALSMDAKILNGTWPVVGSYLVVSNIPFPAYKVELHEPNNFYVSDYLDTKHRKATKTEASLLRYRTISSPIGVEKALQAHHGLLPWTERYEKFLPNYELTSANLIP